MNMQIKFKKFEDRSSMMRWVNAQTNIDVINMDYEHNHINPYIVYYKVIEQSSYKYEIE